MTQHVPPMGVWRGKNIRQLRPVQKGVSSYPTYCKISNLYVNQNVSSTHDDTSLSSQPTITLHVFSKYHKQIENIKKETQLQTTPKYES